MEKLCLQGQVDIGGFGTDTKLTWSALGALNYVFSNHLSISADYKVLNVD